MALSLKKWRLLNEMTREEVAKRCDVHPNTVKNWEENPGSVPVSKAYQLCNIYGANMDDVIFLSENSTNLCNEEE